jgi:hypothetical protein
MLFFCEICIFFFFFFFLGGGGVLLLLHQRQLDVGLMGRGEIDE